MKKLYCILGLVLLIGGCATKDKTVTCKMDLETKDAGAEATYTYDKDNKVTKIVNSSFLALTEEDLKNSSLDEYYKDVQDMYKETEKTKGLKVEITKDEKAKKIAMKIIVDLENYNLEEDILNVKDEGDIEDIKAVVDFKEALGYYKCDKVK